MPRHNSGRCKFSCLGWRVFRVLFLQSHYDFNFIYIHTHTPHRAENITFWLVLCTKSFSPTPWMCNFPLCTLTWAWSSRARWRQATKGCRSGPPENLWSAESQLLSVEVAGFLAPSSVQWYQPLEHGHPLISLSVYNKSRALTSMKEHFLTYQYFTKRLKFIQLCFLSSSTVYAVDFTVTNAAWLWISAVEVDCPNVCRKQKAKWCKRGQGEFI